jgi:hypothetical protein
MLTQINNSYFYYMENGGIINDYYQSIVEIIKKILTNTTNISVNIILGDPPHNIFNNKNKTIIINLNWEHTLVKINGRDTNNAPVGNIICNDDNTNYLVRIDRYNKLNNADIIIDYSIPNIVNVLKSNLFHEFSKKHIYISSSIHELYFLKENRDITTLTTFINIHEERRYKLLENIKNLNIPHLNVNNCFEKLQLQNLYKNTKILINIHQTHHHHTFEELRVLPAIECGVIVICENSPLSHLIPYHNYIIWSSYDDILNKVNEVINNYDYYHNLIFTQKSNILSELNHTNYETLNHAILNKTH